MMSRDDPYDLAVVGGGVAGWTAARRAQDLGARVVVIEKSPEAPGWGNGRLSGGVFHAAYLDPERPPDELHDALVSAGAGHLRSDVTRAWADNCGRALRYLRDQGARFARRTDAEWQWNTLWPFQPVTLGQPWRDFGPDRLLRTMCHRFLTGGGTAVFGARAAQLVQRDGHIEGLEVQVGRRTTSVRARAVLLCDGGFQANAEMVHEHITPSYRLRASDTGTGDGIRMGVAVGAALWNMEWFYGHCMARDALWDNELWPMLSLYQVIEHAIVVDVTGHRFADEGISNQHMANAIAKCAEPAKTWVVCDHTVWSGAASDGPVPPNPTLTDHRATVHVADDLTALALRMEVPPDALGRTVAAFNDAVRAGSQPSPPRSGTPAPIDQPPYYALPLVAGITFTMGGLLVDGNARVLDGDEEPIPGLYAAGGTMGGLQGGPKPAYAGGWSEAATFGLIAAERAMGS